MSRWVMLLALIASNAPLVAAEGFYIIHEHPECIRVAPSGTELTWRIDYTSGEPAADLDGRIIFDGACTGLARCDGTQPTVYTSTTDADGVITFAVEIGGCCENPAALLLELDPGAVTIAVYDAIGSPDSSGDGDVSLIDFVQLFNVYLGEGITCQDLANCDEIVNLPDFVVFMSEFLQSCP